MSTVEQLKQLVESYESDRVGQSVSDVDVSAALFEAVKSGELDKDTFVDLNVILLSRAYGKGAWDG